MKDHEEQQIAEEFYSRIIGKEIMDWAREYAPHLLTAKAENETIAIIKKIKSILDDETLDDSDCYLRIDEIISAFCQTGLPTMRHWESDC